MARTFRKPPVSNRRSADTHHQPVKNGNRTATAAAKAARTINKLFPPSSSHSSAFREVAVLAVVVAITVFVFLGILRTRDDGILDSNGSNKAEAKAEVDRIEKMIQKRLKDMADQATGNQRQQYGETRADGDGDVKEASRKSGKRGQGGGKNAQQKPPPNAFQQFDPNEKQLFTAEEMDQLKLDIQRILGSADNSDDSSNNNQHFNRRDGDQRPYSDNGGENNGE